MAREFTYTVTEEDEERGVTIKEILDRHFNFSSRLRKKIKKARTVFLDGHETPMWIEPSAGSVITVDIPEERSRFTPEPIPLTVLYEDEDLLLLNKQPGIVVHPTTGCPAHTIANGVAQYMRDKGMLYKIHFINRLDMDTSGVLALGKNSHAQDDFVRQSERGEVKKQYLAIVDGIVEDDSGTIDAPIGRPLNEPIRRGVVPDGRPSVTHYAVQERYKNHTLVRLRLGTGRTHQIRVHMKYIGHPVTGDALYGAPSDLIARQALHAQTLSFCHPVSGKPLEITAPLLDDMKQLLEVCRGQIPAAGVIEAVHRQKEAAAALKENKKKSAATAAPVPGEEAPAAMPGSDETAVPAAGEEAPAAMPGGTGETAARRKTQEPPFPRLKANRPTQPIPCGPAHGRRPRTAPRTALRTVLPVCPRPPQSRHPPRSTARQQLPKQIPRPASN
ncbi:MAG: RluA family pseudouridine synthase [Anaerovoracaceae bacterium]|jgi:23S rRNA pseudouridine1911/1915/1917 synthase